MTDTTPAQPDLSSISDDELQSTVDSYSQEIDRRQVLKDLPSRVQTSCWQYKQAGGDPADLVKSMNDWISANP